MAVPAEVYARVARIWHRSGAGVLVLVATCHSEAGAHRVARKHGPGSQVEPQPDGTYQVWALRHGPR